MTTSSSGTETPELDLAVKGSLPVCSPHPSLPSITSITSTAPPSNSLDNAPSSPSQIYLNLLILEASLRSQYLHHLSRRRKFTFFLFLLFLWNAFFFHRIYFLGGSLYYYIFHFEWLGLLGGSITGALYYATGLYEKTIVEPRRFVSTANRGLRGLNVKLVKVPFSSYQWVIWWWNWYTFRPPPPPRRPPSNTNRRLSSTSGAKSRRLSASARRPVPLVHGYEQQHAPSFSSIAMGRTPSQLAPHPEEATEDGPSDEVEEYLPGGLHLKLVILPKRFSADFRESWEIYRTEYWERENEARSLRRKDVNQRYWPLSGLKGREDAQGRLSVPLASTASPAARTRRTSIVSERRSPSVSSRAGTPEPEAVTPTGKRRSGSFATKRRPNMAPGLVPGGRSGDVSDSGSANTTGTERRSESPVTDRSSSSAGTGKRKTSGRGRGRVRKSVIAGSGVGW